MRKKKRSIEDYQRIGSQFKTLHNPLAHLYVDVCKVFGRTTPEAKMLEKGVQLIEKARCSLEDKLFFELPHEAHVRVFYGPSIQQDEQDEKVLKNR